jgi:hypothetical protein
LRKGQPKSKNGEEGKMYEDPGFAMV